MPKRAHSIDSTRVRFSTAARAAEECARPGRPWCGDSVTFTILPPPAGIIALVATAWVISQVPSRLSDTTVRKPFGVMSSAGAMYCPPALLTSVSTRPWRSSTWSTAAATASSSRMSAEIALQRPWSHSPTVSSSGSGRRPITTTCAPQAVSSTAVARPRPDPPPVTTATCPSSTPGAKIFDGIPAGTVSDQAAGSSVARGERSAAACRTLSGAACRTRRAHGAAPPMAAQAGVKLLDALEDELGRPLLLLARRRLDGVEANRVPVLHRHLRELEALPVAGLLGAGDRRRHDNRAGFEREPADPGAGLAERAAARSAALGVHDDDVAAGEDRVGGLERFLVALAAADREDAAVSVDELHRPLEQLRLGHEVDRAPQVDGDEEVIEEGEMIRRDDHRAARRHLVRVDAARPPDRHQQRGQHQADERVDPVWTARACALVEAGEVLRGARILVDLRLHVEVPTRAGRIRYPPLDGRIG